MEGSATEPVKLVAEITLVLILFHDAAQVRPREIGSDRGFYARLLLIGFPLTILLGFLIARLLFPDLPVMMALLLAAALAPTDAGLGAPTVLNPVVPTRIRRALNVESGLNDGLATPVVLFAIAVLAGEEGLALGRRSLGPRRGRPRGRRRGRGRGGRWCAAGMVAAAPDEHRRQPDPWRPDDPAACLWGRAGHVRERLRRRLHLRHRLRRIGGVDPRGGVGAARRRGALRPPGVCGVAGPRPRGCAPGLAGGRLAGARVRAAGPDPRADASRGPEPARHPTFDLRRSRSSDGSAPADWPRWCSR